MVVIVARRTSVAIMIDRHMIRFSSNLTLVVPIPRPRVMHCTSRPQCPAAPDDGPRMFRARYIGHSIYIALISGTTSCSLLFFLVFPDPAQLSACPRNVTHRTTVQRPSNIGPCIYHRMGRSNSRAIAGASTIQSEHANGLGTRP